MNEIQLVIAPKITHKLQEVGANVTKRLSDLNVDSLVATEGTLKDLKKLRADLNKELADYEDQRKFVKSGVMKPYEQLESVYKIEISEKYKSAIDVLKTKIEAVESRIKDEKKQKVENYLNELCVAEGIDFISFDRLNIEINLSTTEKAYREKCDEAISRIKDDLNLIHTSDYEAETLTEYKKSLNASLAITTVRTRKEQEKAEAQRLKQIEINRRIFEATKAGLKYDDFSKTYLFNNEIFITKSNLEDLSKEDFSRKLIECQEKIKLVKQYASPATVVAQSQMAFAETEVLKAPVVNSNAEEEPVTASFKVTGTMSQLMALGEYMRVNNINYINID
jgi:hypothetical protein